MDPQSRIAGTALPAPPRRHINTGQRHSTVLCSRLDLHISQQCSLPHEHSAPCGRASSDGPSPHSPLSGRHGQPDHLHPDCQKKTRRCLRSCSNSLPAHLAHPRSQVNRNRKQGMVSRPRRRFKQNPLKWIRCSNSYAKEHGLPPKAMVKSYTRMSGEVLHQSSKATSIRRRERLADRRTIRCDGAVTGATMGE